MSKERNTKKTAVPSSRHKLGYSRNTKHSIDLQNISPIHHVQKMS